MMIAVDGLRKVYDGFVAVEDSTFSIEQGEVFGLVGPNGAGKTTTLKTMAGLIEPTAGTVTLGGEDPTEPSVRTQLGFLPEESPLYEEMTATSYLSFFADLYGVPDEAARERTARALDRLDLDHRDRRLGDMSKGMKRKVAIARSLVNDPDVLIYDEPASGLDPLTTDVVLEFTGELSADGKTIVLSAHNLFHIERVCDRVAIMNEGEIVTRGTIEDIRADYGGVEYRVFTTVELPDSVPRNGAYMTVVEDMGAVERLRERVTERGGEITDIRTDEPSLEDIFLDLTGQRPIAR
jgi:ABC-2 type transport system ATP-binding protein